MNSGGQRMRKMRNSGVMNSNNVGSYQRGREPRPGGAPPAAGPTAAAGDNGPSSALLAGDKMEVCGVYADPKYAHLLTSVIGCNVRVLTTLQKRYDGVLESVSHKNEFVLGMATEIDSDNPRQIDPDSVRPQLIFKCEQLVAVTVNSVDLEYATRSSSFQTDGAISGSRSNGASGPRELQPWVADDAPSTALVTLDSANGWDAHDMFRINEHKYGVKSTFDHAMPGYTTELHDATPQLERDAAKLAVEIERSVVSQPRVQLPNGGDEEETYSAVVRPVAGSPESDLQRTDRYVPPAKRSGSGPRQQQHRGTGPTPPRGHRTSPGQRASQGRGPPPLHVRHGEPPPHGRHGEPPPHARHGEPPPHARHGEPPPHARHGEPPPHARHGEPPPHARHGEPPPHARHGEPPPHARHGEPPPHARHGEPPPHARHGEPPPHGRHGEPPPHGRHGEPSPHGRHGEPSPHGRHGEPSPHGRHGEPSPHGRHGEPSPHGRHGELSPRSRHGEPKLTPHDKQPEKTSHGKQSVALQSSSQTRRSESQAPADTSLDVADISPADSVKEPSKTPLVATSAGSGSKTTVAELKEFRDNFVLSEEPARTRDTPSVGQKKPTGPANSRVNAAAGPQTGSSPQPAAAQTSQSSPRPSSAESPAHLKSKLNPNAKVFTLNPNAKSFTPSTAPLPAPTPPRITPPAALLQHGQYPPLLPSAAHPGIGYIMGAQPVPMSQQPPRFQKQRSDYGQVMMGRPEATAGQVAAVTGQPLLAGHPPAPHASMPQDYPGAGQLIVRMMPTGGLVSGPYESGQPPPPAIYGLASQQPVPSGMYPYPPNSGPPGAAPPSMYLLPSAHQQMQPHFFPATSVASMPLTLGPQPYYIPQQQHPPPQQQHQTGYPTAAAGHHMHIVHHGQ